MARRACALTLLAFAACSNSDNKTSPTPVRSSPSVAPAALSSDAMHDGDKPQTHNEPAASRLCREFDAAAVAKAMGWSGMERVASLALHPGEWSCHYLAKDHPDGAGFGVSFITALDNPLSDLYARRAPIAGHDAQVATFDNDVTIQLVALGVRIETDASDAGSPKEVEAKLAEATSKLLSTLAIDPAAALRE